jgi:hypothetical protein
MDRLARGCLAIMLLVPLKFGKNSELVSFDPILRIVV